MNIISAMDDPKLFKSSFEGDSWKRWKALLKGFYGLEMNVAEFELYSQLTARINEPQSAFDELFMVIGRRGGKSQIAALIAIYEAFFNDYSSKLSKGEVSTVMVIAADRKQARSVFRYVTGLVNDCPMLRAMVVRETNETLEITNRAVIEITTASHRKTRGYTCSCVIADEIAFWMTGEHSANPDKEIINALRPSLATLNGKLIALSSPYARKGVLWDAYRNYYGKADSNRVLVAQADTLSMNPTLNPVVVAQAYEEDAATAKAEYGGMFRTDVETYISRESVEAVVIPDRVSLPPARANYYFAFVDAAGGSGSDSMTCAIAHKDKETNIVILDAIDYIRPPFSPEKAVERFCDLFKHYRVKMVTGDRWGGDFVQEQFRKRGIAYTPCKETKSELYAELLPLINSARIELLDNKRLFTELTNLERRTSRNGRDSIDHAPSQHDDVINSVAGVLVHVASKSQPRMMNIKFTRG